MIIDRLKEFRESEAGKKWHSASAESWFHQGIQLALSNLYLPPAQDMGNAAANHWRRDGAQLLADKLVTLTEIKESPKAVPMRALHPV